MVATLHELKSQAEFLRGKLEIAFSPETSVAGARRHTLSSGQCAAAAAVVFDTIGGVFVSAIVENESHWFNRIQICGSAFDIDLTGDQFGRPAIQIGLEGSLYDGTRIRRPEELKEETIRRANALARKAGMGELRPITQKP
jgi:hypothetical protein